MRVEKEEKISTSTRDHAAVVDGLVSICCWYARKDSAGDTMFGPLRGPLAESLKASRSRRMAVRPPVFSQINAASQRTELNSRVAAVIAVRM